MITGGTQWGPPSNWNPLQGGGQAMGVRGLLYETLFLFDPWTTELTPFLAETGEWTGENTYELTLRDGLTWQDGTPLTSADVVFTVELGHEPAVKFSNVWTWLESVEAVDDLTVLFTFSDPRKGEWDNFLQANQIVPKHLWADIPTEELGTYANDQNPIGSGAYKYHSHTDTRMVWERNDDWWGVEALGLEMKPRYIVDVVNPSNEVALGLISRGNIDMSNFFLPGIQQLVGGDFNITTFYPEEPYMLSANTAMLIPNTTLPGLDDAAFRRAMARSIDTELIVSNVYGGIVLRLESDRHAPGVGPLRRRGGRRRQRLLVQHRRGQADPRRCRLRGHRWRRFRRDAGWGSDRSRADHPGGMDRLEQRRRGDRQRAAKRPASTPRRRRRRRRRSTNGATPATSSW